MEIVVRHKHGRVPTPLRNLADEKVGRVARFLRDIKRIEVEFDEERNPRVADNDLCEILVHVKGDLLKSHAGASTYEAALDVAIDKVEHQARKLHERRVQRSHPRRSRRGSRNGSAPDPAVVPGVQVPDASGGNVRTEPEIVRVEQSLAKPMSPREAALQMDLLGHDFFLFTSSENGGAAVIYRRRDGDLGLIEAG